MTTESRSNLNHITGSMNDQGNCLKEIHEEYVPSEVPMAERMDQRVIEEQKKAKNNEE